MRQIASEILVIYPEHIESLSNLSVTYLLQGDYQEALKPLLKAERISPHDHVVLSNIAFAYKEMDDKENAVKYYKLTVKYGDEQSKSFAKEQLEVLKK